MVWARRETDKPPEGQPHPQPARPLVCLMMLPPCRPLSPPDFPGCLLALLRSGALCCVFPTTQAAPARAAGDHQAESLPVRLEDEEEAGGGPRRPFGDGTADGAPADGGGAPDAALLRLPSRRRGWSRREEGGAALAGWDCGNERLS